MSELKDKKRIGLFIGLGIATALFFLFGQGVTWYQIGGDTLSYYVDFHHQIEVTPLYPLFFHVLDLLFGRPMYLYAAAVIQMIVAGVCIIAFVAYIAKVFRLETVSIIMVWLASLIPFYLLCPEDPIPHVLMTESFTYPLLYIYMVFILKGLFEKREKWFFLSCLLVEFMALIRGQMMFLFAVSVITYFYYLMKVKFFDKEKKFFKDVAAKTIILLVCALLCIKAGSLFTQFYEWTFFGAPAQSYSNHLKVQKAMYCSDEEDAELFSDEIEKEIFVNAYAQAKENKTTYAYMPGDLYDWYHIECGYGANSYYVDDAIKAALESRGLWSEDPIEQETLILEYCKRLTDVLAKDNWKHYIIVFFNMVPTGFISTVLFQKESIYLLIHWATLLIYIVALASSFLVSKMKKTVLMESELLWLIMGTGIVNVVSANIVHFGIQRYCAYTVGLFYVAMYLVVRRFAISFYQKKKA